MKKTTTETTLTKNELVVLRASWKNALDATAGDFGLRDEIITTLKKKGFSIYQIGALFSTLTEKGLIICWKADRQDDGYVARQITFVDRGQIKKLVA